MTNLTESHILKSVEAERIFCALACMSSEQFDFNIVFGWLLPEMFRDEQMRKYWERYARGEDKFDVALEMGLDSVFAQTISNISPFGWEAGAYAKAIIRHSSLVNVSDQAIKLVKLIAANDADGVQDQILNLSKIDFSVGFKQSHTTDDIDEEFRKVIRANLPVVKTYIPSIDTSLGGFYARDLVIVAARPSMGKTALVLQMAGNIARSGKKALFISTEMSRVQLWARIACSRASVSWQDVRSGESTEQNLVDLENASYQLRSEFDGRLIIHDDAFTVNDIHSAATQSKPDMIFIDQLPDISWHESGVDEVVWYGRALKYFKKIARTLEIPVLVVHQLNRGVELRTEKRPMLADLRQSGEIEQIADVVLMPYREDYYTGRTKGVDNVPMEVWVRKNRQGNKDSKIILGYDLVRQWLE